MGNLTNDMARLREEVDALRVARGALMQDLTRGTKDLATAVAAMRAGFTSAHATMAKQTRKERVAFVAEMKRQVRGMCKDTAGDLMSARLAWHGQALEKSWSMKEESVVTQPALPLAEVAAKVTGTTSEVEPEDGTVVTPELALQAEAAEPPEIKDSSLSTALMEQPEKEEAASSTPSAPQPKSQSQAQNLEEKPGKATASKAKRGTKHNRGGF